MRSPFRTPYPSAVTASTNTAIAMPARRRREYTVPAPTPTIASITTAIPGNWFCSLGVLSVCRTDAVADPQRRSSGGAERKAFGGAE